MNSAADYLSRLIDLTKPWLLMSIAVMGATAVVAGAFEPARLGLLAVLVVSAVFGAATWDARKRVAEDRIERPLVAYEGPLLWVVSAWIAMQLLGGYSGETGYGRELFPFAVALLAWMLVTFPRRVAGAALATAAVIEVGLAVRGAQGLTQLFLHGCLVAFAGFALSRYAQGENFRLRMRELRDKRDEEEATQSRARDFGLLTAQAPKLDELPSLGDTVDSCSLSYLEESLDLQLTLLRKSLGLTTAALLWRTSDGLTLKASSTTGAPLLAGPFAEGLGVPGSVCRDGAFIKLEQVHEKFAGLPYYKTPGGVGGAIVVPVRTSDDDEPELLGILCVDREAPGAWSETDLEVVRQTAEKVALDHKTGRALKAATTQRTTFARFSAAFLRLNRAQGLSEVGAAVQEAVHALLTVPEEQDDSRGKTYTEEEPELMVMTLCHETGHTIVYPHGRDASQFKGRFIDPETLASKALMHDQTLPLSGQYRGHGTVFFEGEQLDWVKSLLVIPLTFKVADTLGDDLREGTDVLAHRVNALEPEMSADLAEGLTSKSKKVKMGCLVVAASNQDAFRTSRVVLDLIAAQVAIKLELAHSHEKIQEMAKTDALTGLANKRTFQLAFDNMLNRSQRRRRAQQPLDPVALILPDIDFFKPLNDNYGHPFGDEILKGVSAVLADTLRSGDLVAARIGGEEFALLLEDCDEALAMKTAERVRAEIEALTFVHPEKGSVSITMSMGVATYPEAGSTPAEIIENADQALYLAKNSGRNQVRAWTELPESSVLATAEVTAHV
jgi:two-component system, cell cycle response regulator